MLQKSVFACISGFLKVINFDFYCMTIGFHCFVKIQVVCVVSFMILGFKFHVCLLKSFKFVNLIFTLILDKSGVCCTYSHKT